MVTLNLFNFNNYYDRVSKYFATLQEYTENGNLLYSWQDRNFNPNDGVSTSCIFNYAGAQPDYCVVTDVYGKIDSRWFVIEARRTTGGQYLVTLLRDLVADYRNVVLNNPCFIEKATLGIDDPLLFNKENMSFNQIRKEQTILYDKTKCPWIVGYMPKDAELDNKTINGNTPVGAPLVDYEVSGLENWTYLPYRDRQTLQYNPNFGVNLDISIAYPWGILSFGRYVAKISKAEVHWVDSNLPGVVVEGDVEDLSMSADDMRKRNSQEQDTYRPIYGIATNSNGVVNSFSPQIIANYLVGAINEIPSFKTKLNAAVMADLSDEGVPIAVDGTLQALNNKILKDTSTNKYYKIKVTSSELATVKGVLSDELTSEIARQITIFGVNYPTNEDPDLRELVWTMPASKYIRSRVDARISTLTLEEVNVDASVTLPADIVDLTDAPYKMFCIPYGNLTCVIPEGNEFTNNPAIGLNIATNIATTLGAANVYDLQLLPYCPIQSAIENNKLLLARVPHSLIKAPNGPDVYSVICWCTESNFTFTLSDYQIPIGATALDRKINSETVMYRLCSPNGAGQFELDPELNDGVNAWEVNCTYKPFQPFIQIKPVFGGLYGIETETDYRGLICGGDFSLPQLSDAWANYQLNNKTYQEQFDREIQNLKVNQNVARAGEAFGLLAASVGGFIGGASKGGQAGPVGAVAGALLGEAAAGVSSLARTAMKETIREETLDYRQDLFGFQLANIKAIPQSITKTAANVINNPLVPYLEKYECTTEERQALIDKLYYNGMTVGRIGYIDEYLRDEPTYIKGKLIRTAGLQDDYHIAEALANEINKGVFL